MSVRRQRFRGRNGAVWSHWMVDIVFEVPGQGAQRVGKISPVQTRRGALAYEREARAALLAGTWGKPVLPRTDLGRIPPRFLE